MCAISYYLERQGVMTTGISLVRENAESMAPPRSLWVTFPLGRPLGKPNDADFQHQVIATALDLLRRPAGPVLEDFPLDAPPLDEEYAAACPVSFEEALSDADTWQTQLAAELTLLKPWYELGRRRRRRTTVGACENSIEEILKKLGALLDANELPVAELKWFKLAIEDAKAYYTEALTAQPGAYAVDQVHKTLWQDTRLGAALREFYTGFQSHPRLSILARMVAPRQAIGASTGEEVEIGIDELTQRSTE